MIPSVGRTPQAIERAVESLRILHEDSDEVESAFADAHTQISTAQRLYFLGFGYHPSNVALIQALPARVRGDISIHQEQPSVSDRDGVVRDSPTVVHPPLRTAFDVDGEDTVACWSPLA